VIDVKNIENDKWFVTTDGSRNDVDPFFKKTSYLDEEIYLKDSNIVSEQIVSGCTCLEYDRLFTLKNKPLLNVGDRIKYRNVGAYTMCLTPMFIRYIPHIYAKDNGNYFLIREKWTAQDYIHKSKI
jgi:diaminopimelate decarboxylase